MGPASGLESGLVPPSERSRPQFQLWFQTPCQLQSPRQSLRSLRGSGGTRRGWDPGPRHLCLRGDLGGPGPPSDPRTSGPGESSSSRPQPSPATSAAEATSSPQLSPASKIRRLLFVGNPIPGNVRLHRKEFHQESYYDVSVLISDHRFRDSMRLIEHYSLLPFMMPRQFYYPRVVLQFYHSMTS